MVTACRPQGTSKRPSNMGRNALRYFRWGWAPIPLCWPDENGKCGCGQGHSDDQVGKAPLVNWAHYVEQPPTRDQVIAWWADWPLANIGILLEPSGLSVVDADNEEAIREAEALGLPTGPWTRTGKGKHFYFRAPEEVIGRTTKRGNSRKIDILAKGYVVAAPSQHRTGREYAWEIWPQETFLAEPPAWAVKMLTESSGLTSDKHELIPLPKNLPRLDVSTLRVSERIKKLIRTGEDAERYPSRSEAEFAVIGALILKRYTDIQIASVLLDPANGISEKPRERGQKWVMAEIIRARSKTGQVGVEEVGERGSQSDPLGAKGKEEMPDPISIEMPPLPTLPARQFAPWVDEMVEAVAAHTETPRELAAMNAVAVLATCCQQKFVVQAEPGYLEPTNIWTLSALDSGNRKTAVMGAMTKPLRDWERDQAEAMQAEILQAESDRKTREARIQSLRARAAKAGSEDFENIEREIRELEASLPDTPKPQRLWGQDITPEKLGQMMAENNEAFAILSDEGGIFDIIGGRYSNGIPNLDVWLQAHAGASVRVDRGSRPSVMLKQPALTIGLCPQPEVLRGLTKKPEFRGRGLLARFLYVVPPSRLGYRTLESVPIPSGVRKAYEAGVRALLNIRPQKDETSNILPDVLMLTKQAHQVWKAFAHAVEQDLRDGGRFAPIKEWAGKLPGAAIRLAGLLHCAQYANGEPWHEPIRSDTVQCALTIAEVVSAHTLAAFQLMGADPAVEGALKVWRWVSAHQRETFTARECFQALKGAFHRMDNLEAALGVLHEHFYIFSDEDEVKKAGRPSRRYRVHPKLMENWP